MLYRLLVNLNARTKAGSIVTAEDLGERFGQLDAQGFLEVYAGDLDETAGRSAFEAALEAYRLHMEAAPPLIIAVLEETKTDDQVIALRGALFEISSTVPKEIQRVMAEVFERARELAEADVNNIPASAFASLSTATAEGAASMDAAPDHNAPAAEQAASATHPEGAQDAPASAGGSIEAETLASTEGAAAGAAASNDTPEAEDQVAPKAPAAKRGGPKKSGAA